ncbi:hypothetical protein L6258_03635 [Candidatus Parcubacteria bacterium]|nr:hypothetical protein [Candidatus Parcubacteria bacterium]
MQQSQAVCLAAQLSRQLMFGLDKLEEALLHGQEIVIKKIGLSTDVDLVVDVSVCQPGETRGVSALPNVFFSMLFQKILLPTSLLTDLRQGNQLRKLLNQGSELRFRATPSK